MKYKENWEESVERWTALWSASLKDRPVICVTAPNGKSADIDPPVDGYQKFMDADYIIRSLRANAETTWFGGEAFPSSFLNSGWITTCYGAEPRFEIESIWFDPLEIDWDNPPGFELDFEAKWFCEYENLHRRVLDETVELDIAMGGLCGMPGHDMLSLLLGTETFLMNLIDRPDWMKQTILKTAENVQEVKQYFSDMTREKNSIWYGGGWSGFWGPEPYATAQSDVSCMLSPEMFEEFVVPELDLRGGVYGKLWYHLDGPDALKHLPKLLSLDYLKVIQWVPGAGAAPNGPEWMDLYKQIQEAGRIVDITVQPEYVKELASKLDPSLLCIHTSCESVTDAEELLYSY